MGVGMAVGVSTGTRASGWSDGEMGGMEWTATVAGEDEDWFAGVMGTGVTAWPGRGLRVPRRSTRGIDSASEDSEDSLDGLSDAAPGGSGRARRNIVVACRSGEMWSVSSRLMSQSRSVRSVTSMELLKLLVPE